ncbi:TfuA-like protein [Ruegeria atlantica]|uniref:TfuA-like protein n=1 Tax=Ruegeria atlantica TaxID=81569 RepID=UPI00249511F1|nr:TfuA-like protein [Ruegeria atlantica]
MTVVVFVGPTLPAQEVTAQLNAAVLPPVQRGDVYRAAKDQPHAIGIIDGFFEGVPSVWHKEILWAMEQGIPVFGSASMGALRAAELADFGMIGVGGIFEDYLSGVLQDDDEVAVLHSPAELGFQPLSTPMVSIRATVKQAQAQGILPAESAAEILEHAKSRHYRHRIWQDIGQEVNNLPGVEAFLDWLPKNQVDAKADDARTMLALMADCLSQGTLPSNPVTRTEPTLVWKQLRNRIDADVVKNNAVIDELRLDPELFSELRDRAVLSVIAQEEATEQDQQPDRETLIRQMTDHRAKAGLSHKAHLMEWLDSNDLNLAGYEDMLADAARIDAAVAARLRHLDGPLLAELKRTGKYVELRDRAVAKSNAAVVNGPVSGADRLRMVLWYFEKSLGTDVPDNLDSYAISLGLTGRAALDDLIEAEFLFCGRNSSAGASNGKAASVRHEGSIDECT